MFNVSPRRVVSETFCYINFNKENRASQGLDMFGKQLSLSDGC